ncbi:MAG: tricarballylate utilization 4Fe-4S protein TcuB [Deltaproteobacteria bacterium]|nr:MAG: tricarballylate utilization 4Fe-4S protein TcuB [Deltaproteobacteria bacterium]RLC19133.1 MAG: tricarballylate utilization 4Fe-4S protein TcuB [Deltaproteobacteria bacterium]
MPEINTLAEAERVMTFCNACRYCEGFCAVFPAMELRRTFAEADLNYLANLCHNCRDCYYACQYAPPHEFALNIPKTFTELRLETYQKLCWPRSMAGVYRSNGLVVSWITIISVLIVSLLTLLFSGPAKVFSTHLGEKAFYTLIPYAAIVPLALILVGLMITGSLIMAYNFWHVTGGKLAQIANLQANRTALMDALRLKYLTGGGYGCNYPGEQFSMARRWLHHFVFYGLMLCFVSTAVAAIYEHFFHHSAPYPFLSWPVILGTTGGVALLIGTSGLFYLKLRMDTIPSSSHVMGMDVSFLALLFLTSLTGLLLMMFRETSAMGTLLMVHLGFVVAFFITMPYGKFIHAIYRYASLLKNAIEQKI